MLPVSCMLIKSSKYITAYNTFWNSNRPNVFIKFPVKIIGTRISGIKRTCGSIVGGSCGPLSTVCPVSLINGIKISIMNGIKKKKKTAEHLGLYLLKCISTNPTQHYLFYINNPPHPFFHTSIRQQTKNDIRL